MATKKRRSTTSTCKTAGRKLGVAGGIGKANRSKSKKARASAITRRTKTSKASRSILGSKLVSCKKKRKTTAKKRTTKKK
tara:strand:+ start:21352 stop:21591 length:240 start_codon:yes stop_codon:yes gene_type:complete